MNIKTVSQLTPLDGDINLSSYFGVSQYNPDTNGFGSRKVLFDKIQNQITEHIDDQLFGEKYQAKTSNNDPINIRTIRTDVNNILTSNITFNGTKTFTKTPIITETVDTKNPNNVVNVQCVNNLINTNAGFIAEGQHLDFDPGNGHLNYTRYDGHEENPKQMYWHIDHNKKDSSEWINEYGKQAGSVICKHTGNLVCYG